MPFMPTKEAKRRYIHRAIPALIATIGLHWAIPAVVEHTHPSRPVALVLALLPSLALIALFVFIVQFLSEDRDEVQIAYRRHAVAWSTGALLATILLLNGLSMYRVIEPVTIGVAFPVFAVYLIVAGLALRKQYR